LEKRAKRGAQEWCYNRDDYPRASSSAAIMFS